MLHQLLLQTQAQLRTATSKVRGYGAGHSPI
jgi:hypothetical protein